MSSREGRRQKWTAGTAGPFQKQKQERSAGSCSTVFFKKGNERCSNCSSGDVSTDCGGLGRTLQQTRWLNEMSADNPPTPPRHPGSAAIRRHSGRNQAEAPADGVRRCVFIRRRGTPPSPPSPAAAEQGYTHTLHPSGKFSFTTHTHTLSPARRESAPALQPELVLRLRPAAITHLAATGAAEERPATQRCEKNYDYSR